MKIKIIFLLPIVLLLSCAVEKESSMITEKKAGRLSIQMKHYFLETLKRTYGLEDDAKLFEKFLEAFVSERDTGFTQRDSIFKGINLNLKLDIAKLEKINNILFKRTFSGYYYFFPEIKFLKENPYLINKDSSSIDYDYETNAEYYKDWTRINPMTQVKKGPLKQDADILIITSMVNENLSPNIQLLPTSFFVEDIEKLDLKTTSFILNSIDYYREVYYYLLANYIINNTKEELANTHLQEVLSIIFWKQLCVEAGINFYTPPS